MQTLLELRVNIPTFIHITHGKCHDVGTLDELAIIQNAIYVMNKAYTDFKKRSARYFTQKFSYPLFTLI